MVDVLPSFYTAYKVLVATHCNIKNGAENIEHHRANEKNGIGVKITMLGIVVGYRTIDNPKKVLRTWSCVCVCVCTMYVLCCIVWEKRQPQFQIILPNWRNEIRTIHYLVMLIFESTLQQHHITKRTWTSHSPIRSIYVVDTCKWNIQRSHTLKINDR